MRETWEPNLQSWGQPSGRGHEGDPPTWMTQPPCPQAWTCSPVWMALFPPPLIQLAHWGPRAGQHCERAGPPGQADLKQMFDPGHWKQEAQIPTLCSASTLLLLTPNQDERGRTQWLSSILIHRLKAHSTLLVKYFFYSDKKKKNPTPDGMLVPLSSSILLLEHLWSIHLWLLWAHNWFRSPSASTFILTSC